MLDSYCVLRYKYIYKFYLSLLVRIHGNRLLSGLSSRYKLFCTV
jgi:hypothetical protein